MQTPVNIPMPRGKSTAHILYMSCAFPPVENTKHTKQLHRSHYFMPHYTHPTAQPHKAQIHQDTTPEHHEVTSTPTKATFFKGSKQGLQGQGSTQKTPTKRTRQIYPRTTYNTHNKQCLPNRAPLLPPHLQHSSQSRRRTFLSGHQLHEDLREENTLGVLDLTNTTDQPITGNSTRTPSSHKKQLPELCRLHFSPLTQSIPFLQEQICHTP